MASGAFIPPATLRTTTFATRRTPCTDPLAAPLSRASPPPSTRMQNSLPNFDEIAKQLSKELQIRRTPDQPLSQPSPDAPPDQQPIHLTTGHNDMPVLYLRHQPSQQQVEVYLYGAAVTSWTTRGEDHFWLSGTNKWQPGGKAIRGGIPICFPQFGPYGDLVQHGFARVSNWAIRSSDVLEDTSVTATFTMDSESTSEQVAKWPHKFSADYTVTLSNSGLETKLAITNTGDKPFDFTCAFHNYFRTSTIREARIFGFEGVTSRNRLDADKTLPPLEDTGSGVLLSEETDRIFLNAPDELAMFDFASLKVLKIKKTPTLPDATLWNPFGAEGADPDWEKFVCIEPACIDKPAVVQPGDTWVGAQLLGVE
eukprot:GFKZ01001389.1.p1 GENE.GFKZ01001389.1~~GFKZ01001389.1.p1  ORF type:complete len:377 (-),score=31.25 GFKZ01001389.1:972-2075(-)